MQLLDSDQLEYAFQRHGIDRETQARAFYADLWALIQQAEKVRDGTARNLCERRLRALCRRYFSSMRRWRQEEEEKHDSIPACDHSTRNMREAQAALPAFEKQFFRYVLCYMDLNRALIQTRGTISRFAKGCNIDSEDILQVNHGTGLTLARLHKDRLELMEKRLRLERVRGILCVTDRMIESLGEDLPRLLGQGEGDRQLTLFKGALRRRKFSDCRALVHGWPEILPKAMAQHVIGHIEAHAETLRAQDSLMLHSGELFLVFAFLHADEEQVSRLVEKFNVPYMVYQYRSLLHQGYLLGRIGSLEGLIIQHARLLSLSARPQGDPAAAQGMEQAVLLPVRALLQTRFRTLGAIFNDMETALGTLDRLFSQTREYAAHTPVQ